ncbi:hypothetical protein CTAYLR_006382 [Chrysophaeum taylorii]|uniref:Stress-response A/B barrel domain-containing protein n=1 Tax=Chrysophaeum taylorii TaxID=2483200 RepID=A0AAD7U6I3_9STRA|nr:hypothetical protein CTAYLR_006382 [Chrysophaeum taylorii]
MAPIQHTVVFKFPEVGPEGEREMQAVVEKFNSLEGIQACLGAKPGELDTTDRSGGFTHTLFVIAETASNLKTYLHHAFHLTDWMAAVKPYGKGIVVFDSDLLVDLETGHILHVVLLMLSHQPEPSVAAALNSLEGIRASLAPHKGPAFLESVSWPDKADGYTHLLTVTARDSTRTSPRPSAVPTSTGSSSTRRWALAAP